MSTKDTTFSGRAESDSARTGFISELFSAKLYKRNQGRMVRQITCITIWVVVAVAAYRLQPFLASLVNWAGGSGRQSISYLLSVALGAMGAWIAYRLVNWPRFADFLISVEAELNKVSWPTQKELVKAALVVIFTILFMSAILFLYDAIWRVLFQALGIS